MPVDEQPDMPPDSLGSPPGGSTPRTPATPLPKLSAADETSLVKMQACGRAFNARKMLQKSYKKRRQVSEMMNCILRTRNFAFQRVNCVLIMIGRHGAPENRGDVRERAARASDDILAPDAGTGGDRG